MVNIDEKAISRKEFITVEFFFKLCSERFGLSIFTDSAGMDRKIYDQNLHRPGLALAGFVDLFSYTRVQIFGNTEMRYLSNLTEIQKRETLERLFNFNLPCIILTNKNEPPGIMLELAKKYSIPIFGSQHSTTKLFYLVSDFLDDQFANRISIHGSFVDVYGVGILFVGKSGVGKSEVALDLVERGHRLVADDLIILTKKGEGILWVPVPISANIIWRSED